MSSLALSPFTMAAALAAGDRILENPNWIGDPNNKDQSEFLEHFRRRAKIADALSEISTNATELVSQHIDWLKRLGWDADITNGSPGDLFLAAVLAIGGKWETEGYAFERDGIRRARVPGVLVDEASGIALIPTQTTGLTFMIREAKSFIRNNRELEDAWIELDIALDSDRLREGEVDFQMIDLKVSAGAAYMLGLHSGPNVVSQASEGFELKMNHKGGLARAKAEVAVSRGVSRPKPLVVINGPSIVAVTKDDIDEPIFLAYVDKDSWKDPGETSV